MVRESAEDALGYIRRYLETQAVARSQADATPARACLVELAQWLEQRYALQLEHGGAQLRTDAPPGTPPVTIDPLVLRQVCENLVSNAIKYAPGSDIELSVHAGAPGYRRVHVEDRGPGIPPAQQAALF